LAAVLLQGGGEGLALRVVGLLLLAVLLVAGRRRRRQVYLDVAVEEGEELVILALREGVGLVVVALGAAQPHAREDPPRRVRAGGTGKCSWSTPPSRLVRVLRWKPVATFCSSVAPGSRSPASCSTTNSS